MCTTMVAKGKGRNSPKAGGVRLAPGFGFIRNTIIDQHFAARARMGRLLCAIAENPRMLGIGIDEDTAIVVEAGRRLSVLGRGAVYVFDGSALSYSNISDEEEDQTISIHDVRLHVLSEGDSFSLRSKSPLRPK